MSFPGAGPSGGHAGAAGLTFNPPPDWPRPPADWVPPEGWQPDPAWPPRSPEGWSFWVPASGAPAADPADPAGQGDGEIRVSLGGQSFAIRPGQEIRIGRLPENDIVVPDPAVSRQHGLVRHGLGGWEFAQTGSAPTFMNGERVSQVTVDRAVDLALGTPQRTQADPGSKARDPAAAGGTPAGDRARSQLAARRRIRRGRGRRCAGLDAAATAYPPPSWGLAARSGPAVRAPPGGTRRRHGERAADLVPGAELAA